MKSFHPCLLSIMILISGSLGSQAQIPVITSFSQNGDLVCSNLPPKGVGVIEWASTPTGPWTNTWNNLAYVTANSNGVIHVSVPMYYRVRGADSPTNGMQLISAGTFLMGNATGDPDITDASSTLVYVSGFYMDANLVSYDYWSQVRAIATNALGYTFSQGAGAGTNYPVINVAWYDAARWCNARSQIEGLTPVYYWDATFTQVFTNGTYPGTTDYRPFIKWDANGYRLPTEAEWEKAARGGIVGKRFPYGDTISESQANYLSDTNTYIWDLGPMGYNAAGFGGAGTTPVGSFAANGYGLMDMCGNVREWCNDVYAAPPFPPGSPYLGGSDPHGATTNGIYNGFVTRGGFYSSPPAELRCAARVGGVASAINHGFRCVRKQ
jgi:formylglycine-generating enzyme